MERRPWSLVILAWLQILTPLGDILIGSWVSHVSPFRFFILAIHNSSWHHLIQWALLGPIAGCSIYMMKRWSYLVFLVCVSWVVVSNFYAWKMNPGLISPGVLVFFCFLNFGLVSYFLIPSVRRIYFDDRLKWWESKPRYTLQIPIEFKAKGKTQEGVLINLSETGALLNLDTQLEEGATIGFSFALLGKSFRLQGEVIYRKDGKGSSQLDYLYAVLMRSTPEDQKILKRVICALDLLGLERRPKKEVWHKSLVSWVREILKEGKGLLPK